MVKRWKVRPEHSNWGDFGDDDQIGCLNLITPERRRKAAAEVREGIAFCLSLPLDLPGEICSFRSGFHREGRLRLVLAVTTSLISRCATRTSVGLIFPATMR
jgi:hypothetical protein